MQAALLWLLLFLEIQRWEMQADVSESFFFFLRIYQLHIGSIHMLVGSNSVFF